jgi:hypothetical protein
MANPAVLKKTLAAASANAIALLQTPVSGTKLTLNGAAVVNGVAVLDTQRRILLSFGNEAAQRTLAIAGFTDTGLPVSETLIVPAGAGAGTVASVYDYKQLISAFPAGGGWSANVTLGTNTIGSTPWWLPNYWLPVPGIAADIEFVTGGGGAVTASIEYTDDTLLLPMNIYGGQPATAPPPIVNGWPGLTAVNNNAYSVVDRQAAGVRLTVTGTGAQVQSNLRQSISVTGPSY